MNNHVPERRFAGKTVIVTGASSGIGEGCARRFAAEGANVVLAARRKDKLGRIAAELGASNTLVAVTDVSKRAEVRPWCRLPSPASGSSTCWC